VSYPRVVAIDRLPGQTKEQASVQYELSHDKKFQNLMEQIRNKERK
jgi:hypothetical protein